MPDINRVANREALIRFFGERRDPSVMEAAGLLGWNAAAVLRRAREEDALLPDSRIAWPDVAIWLLQVWPRAQLLGALGKHAALIPVGLHLTTVTWRLPVYVVRAVERQGLLRRAGREGLHSPHIDDYVAEVLDLMIEDDTIAALRNDVDFLEAYGYPCET
ncbi:MAG TPA: hypothetical protein VG323_15945 [Thermoanaerobaculia bacterium]|nr:hypothetical protein [Thermoanaerobaculia bacterium]